MSLVAAAAVTLGRKRYDSHVARLEVQLGLLPRINQARIRLPRVLALEAAPGDDAELALEGVDGRATVLHGKVQSIATAGGVATEVVLADGGALLAALRPARSYQGQDGSAVVRALVRDAGAEVGTLDLDLPLSAYIAHGRRSAAEHVADLARLGGALAGCDEAGRIELRARPSRAERALRHDREILALRIARGAPPAYRQVLVGNGPATADLLRHGAGPLPDDAPSPGAAARWRAAPVLRSARAAVAAGQARDAEGAAGATRLSAQAILLPWLRPGLVVEIQNLPERLDAGGAWLVLTVCHSGGAGIAAGTRFTAVSAEAGSSLLGSLAGAVGGLL